MDNSNENSLEIKLGRIQNLKILIVLPILLLLLSFIFDKPANILKGLYSIIISPDILLTDYLLVGGLGATLINSSIVGLVNIFIIYKLNLKINGALLAAVFTLIGFSFLGKNIYNIWPMYIGGLLYVKFMDIEFKNILVVIMFSTALAPVVSEISFALNLPIYFGIILGITFGILCGFIITPLSSHMLTVHEGYNLYNIGFTAGVIGTIINSLFKSFGISIPSQLYLSGEYDMLFKIFLLIFFIFLIVLGFVVNGRSFRGYSKILSYSGRLVTDFTQLVGYGLTYINMGIMGIIAMLYVMLLGGEFNGPIVGGILTLAGFSAFGNHPKNSIPIMIGILLAGILKIWDVSSTVVIIAGLFGTTLAPIAGKYGIFAGIFAGFIHLSVVMNVGVIHGGMNLYNNGFSGGLVAATLFPIFNALKKGD